MQVSISPAQLRSVIAAAITTTILGLVAIVTVALAAPSTAQAHAELYGSSPAAGETVGGEIHAITLQFFDLDVNRPQEAKVFDAAGNELAGQTNREDQRMVIALIDPITTPGDYLVTYAVNGVDGDFSEESFTFTWQEGAPEPAAINLDFLTPDDGFDVTGFVLLLIGAGLLAFLVQRFVSAYRDHKAAQVTV